MKTHKTEGKLSRPFSGVDTIGRCMNYEYRIGHYSFYHGVVRFYCEPKFATFTFVYGGKIYGLNLSGIKKPLTDRQLILQAGKFGHSIIDSLYL